MNDIEILELFIKSIRSDLAEESEDNQETAHAIENLIKENKELKEKQKEYEKQLDLDYVKENYIPKSKLKNVKNYIENKMDIVDNPTICGDEEDTITELPISLSLYNEDLRSLLELLEC